MQEIKEILEKIQRPRNKDELLPAWWIRDNILTFVDQAIAKLEEGPEASLLVKKCRALIRKGITDEQWELSSLLLETCEAIDQLQAENKQLVDGQVAKKEAGS